MIKHKNIRISAAFALVLVLVLSALLASCALTEDEKHIAVESSVLIAGKDASELTVLLDDYSGYTVSVDDDSILKLEKTGDDPSDFQITPVGEGTTQIIVTTSAGETYKKDIKVYKSTLSLGLQSLVIGMGTVFSALIVLWIILAIFGKVAKATSKRKSKEEKPAAPAAAEAPVESADTNDQTDEREIIAAIVAAISAYTEKDASSFKVVSFKRKSTIKSWNNQR